MFDQVRTCDNHCAFCFIYQLPPGMRRSLYLKDDDYRLSFLYGNFTTLTRFTEADFERVVTEGLSPLYVSIHATDRDKRTEMLRNRRGATSLRWLAALLDAGIEVHGQIVVCPGVNDGAVLEDTLVDRSRRLPGAGQPGRRAARRQRPLQRARYAAPHHGRGGRRASTWSPNGSRSTLDVLGRRLVFAADEYYLLAGRPFPPSETYEGFAMHEDGIGMARTFELEFAGLSDTSVGTASGFFAWVDGAPAEGYRAPRVDADEAPTGGGGIQPVTLRPSAKSPVAILTGHYGARVLEPLLRQVADDLTVEVRVVEVENHFFGGNIGVTGLMVGADVARHLAKQPAGHRYLLPDVCLSGGRFLDGTTVDDLPRPVEIVGTDGLSLRRALGLPTTEIVDTIESAVTLEVAR